jgi:DNA repair exonuclease SbcCD ATPase subunit
MHTISNTVERKFINSIDLADLEIETDSGWQPVTSIHKTVPYTVWQIKTESGLELECADTHIIFDEDYNEIFVKDLKENQSKILTINGPELVVSVCENSCQENMFDLTVNSNDRRFFTNGILSHNTTIINALSYALYGIALTNIKKDNLINKINSKGMLVTVTFVKDGVTYHIERGRKPNILKFTINDHEHIANDTDESQGDSRETQKVIEEVFGMGHTMFKHLVALNTYTEPFLSLKSGEQRQIIEELLGITLLSEKANALKEKMKVTRDAISTENIKLDTIRASNDRIQQSINSLIRKQRIWEEQKELLVKKLTGQISELETVDIEAEITLQRDLELWSARKKDHDMLSSAVARQVSAFERETRSLEKLESELAVLKEKTCHSCGQELHDDRHNEMLSKKEEQVAESRQALTLIEDELTALSEALDSIGVVGSEPAVHYRNLEEALNHRSTLEALEKELVAKSSEVNPYADQIDELENSAVQELDWTNINDLNKVKDHQEFLYKLLTNKDSFVRKRIIDQNLAFLNQRLTHYLDKIGLPHIVEFENDLSVTITQLGQDLDFDNLSRGERNRLILSMSWAFRDVWESLYHSINLVFIDELIDSGLDGSGVELSLGILKKMMRERRKSVFLISHREELQNRVGRILRVIKENGFTSYDPDVEAVG